MLYIHAITCKKYLYKIKIYYMINIPPQISIIFLLAITCRYSIYKIFINNYYTLFYMLYIHAITCKKYLYKIKNILHDKYTSPNLLNFFTPYTV